jgi:hypothetical protein
MPVGGGTRVVEVTVADPLAVAALASGAALLLVVVLVVVLRRRDPIGQGVAGYAVTLQALRDTAARTPTGPPGPRTSRDSPPTVSVIASSEEGVDRGA